MSKNKNLSTPRPTKNFNKTPKSFKNGKNPRLRGQKGSAPSSQERAASKFLAYKPKINENTVLQYFSSGGKVTPEILKAVQRALTIDANVDMNLPSLCSPNACVFRGTDILQEDKFSRTNRRELFNFLANLSDEDIKSTSCSFAINKIKKMGLAYFMSASNSKLRTLLTSGSLSSFKEKKVEFSLKLLPDFLLKDKKKKEKKKKEEKKSSKVEGKEAKSEDLGSFSSSSSVKEK
jgi:hypothetical protein